ncbi:MAG: hypothetical protein QMB11_04700 [Nonlabens sp.]
MANRTRHSTKYKITGTGGLTLNVALSDCQSKKTVFLLKYIIIILAFAKA